MTTYSARTLVLGFSVTAVSMDARVRDGAEADPAAPPAGEVAVRRERRSPPAVDVSRRSWRERDWEGYTPPSNTAVKHRRQTPPSNTAVSRSVKRRVSLKLLHARSGWLIETQADFVRLTVA